MPEPITSQRAQLLPRPLLTPESSAITAFALAVLCLLGPGAWTTALAAFLPTGFPPSEFGAYHLLAGLGAFAIAVGAWWLARGVLTTAARVPGWVENLARAATVMSILGAVLAVLTIVGGLRGILA